MKNKTIKVNLDEVVDLNINIVLSNGVPAIQFRKVITACDKNMGFVKNIIKKTLENDDEIIMPVKLKIYNKPLAKGKLKKVGLLNNQS